MYNIKIQTVNRSKTVNKNFPTRKHVNDFVDKFCNKIKGYEEHVYFWLICSHNMINKDLNNSIIKIHVSSITTIGE